MVHDQWESVTDLIYKCLRCMAQMFLFYIFLFSSCDFMALCAVTNEKRRQFKQCDVTFPS